MKKLIFIVVLVGFLYADVEAQCSVCTKSASQLGEKPAKALNSAIVYLMLAPFAIAGVIGYRWWKNNKES
jgi:TRAP-type C4-dicarboxylate transport system permease small subunit